MFGDMLAERRRQLGFSISQASRVLRLREDVIIAFEEGDFERMPKSGYAQGMLSSYARYLGLDANMVVEAYVQDFERYKREGRRRAAGSRRGPDGLPQQTHVQPHMPKRGLLPTSGGLAGDMGSFATTRVRTRGSSGSVEHEDSLADYTQVRPYTDLSQNANPNRQRYGTGVDARQLSDDVRYQRSSSGRIDTSYGTPQDSSRRNTSQRRNPSRGRSGSSSRGSNGRGGQRQKRRRTTRRGIVPPQVVLAIGIVVVVGIALLLVLSIGSCVRHEPSSSHIIPVASSEEATTTKDTSSTKSESSTKTKKTETTSSTNTKSTTTTTTTGSKDKSKVQEEQSPDTNVAVSVTDGSVTWLEIECDGSSKVAETITGPWHKTYTVKESITIQAGDTSAVSVVQDGQQVQFESMASGLGTIRIDVPIAQTSETAKKTQDSEDESESTTGYTSDYDEYDQTNDNGQSYYEESYDYDQY